MLCCTILCGQMPVQQAVGHLEAEQTKGVSENTWSTNLIKHFHLYFFSLINHEKSSLDIPDAGTVCDARSKCHFMHLNSVHVKAWMNPKKWQDSINDAHIPQLEMWGRDVRDVVV